MGFNSGFKGLTSSGSKENVPKYGYLSEAKASQSHKTWIEVSSSAPHPLCITLICVETIQIQCAVEHEL